MKESISSKNIFMKSSNFFLLICLLSNNSFGQAPPGTDIFVVDIVLKDSQFVCKEPLNITNRKGYDNQPSFSPDGKFILYSSIREDLQTDVYKYDLKKKENVQITKTKEDEYSPTLMSDAKHFSVVRVEPDSTQRLWSFDLDGNNSKLINPMIDSVGYHCWLNPGELALFILTEPFTLQLCNTQNSNTKILAQNIGRSIHKKNDNSFLFTQLIDSVRWICSVDVNGNSSKLLECLEGSEDFAMYSENIFLMAKGSQLFQTSIGKNNSWKLVKDFSGNGVNKINRIAISKDKKKLAFVSLE